jgi:hypothetical protein
MQTNNGQNKYHYLDLLIHAKLDVNIDVDLIGLVDCCDERIFDKFIEGGFDLGRYHNEVLEYATYKFPEAVPLLLDRGYSLILWGPFYSSPGSRKGR